MEAKSIPAETVNFSDGDHDFKHLTFTSRTTVDAVGNAPAVKELEFTFTQDSDDRTKRIDFSMLLSAVPPGKLNGITRKQLEDAILGIMKYARKQAPVTK